MEARQSAFMDVEDRKVIFLKTFSPFKHPFPILKLTSNSQEEEAIRIFLKVLIVMIK